MTNLALDRAANAELLAKMNAKLEAVIKARSARTMAASCPTCPTSPGASTASISGCAPAVP